MLAFSQDLTGGRPTKYFILFEGRLDFDNQLLGE